MNKKYYSLTLASMMLMLAASCSQEESIKGSSSDEMVAFNISLDGATQSRGAGDGSTVTKLHYEVYQNGRKVLDNLGDDANADPVAINEDGIATVEMPIMRGEKYDIMFWAEAENSVYDATDLKEIKVNYLDENGANQTVSNQETYDAFFYGEAGFTATTNETTVVLTRPFGQLNIGTTLTDWNKAITMIDAGKPITASQVKVKGLANRFNVLTHVAFVAENTEVGEVTFAKAELLGEMVDEVKVVETFETGKDDEGNPIVYKNLAMNYLLIPSNVSPEGVSHTGNVDITAASFWRKGNEPLFDIVVPNVPVTRNWRTNILGDLLAADKTFEIVIDPIFANDYNYPETMEEQLRMAAAIGGKVTLTEDVKLAQPLNVMYDMTIDLGGHTISNTTALWNDTDVKNDWSLISVQNGSTLTIKGEGTVAALENDCYAVDVKEGSTVNIEGGKYVGNISAVYVSQGTANIKGGEFSIQQLATGDSYQFTLNCLDENYKNETAKIVVTGGKFFKFNPSACAAEGAGTNFVAEGFETKTSGDWTSVIGDVTDIVWTGTQAKVYTAEGLLEFVNIVNNAANNEKNDFNLSLMCDIEMPLYTIAQNAEGKYEYTDTPITLDENGEPTGSNWVPICSEINVLEDGFKGCIDGNGITISNLYIKRDASYTGLVGFMYDGGEIKNLTIANSVIKGADYTGIVGGRSQHGSRIENVHVVNSSIMGNGHVGGIVGYNYRRDKVGVDEDFAYVKDCSTDKDTKIVATDDNVGGICGTNYGAIIVNCVNNADVTGKSAVGGIVGYSRDYWSNSDGTIVADGYVLASRSTAEALVKATNGSAGGVIGYSLADNQHAETKFYAVACHSASVVEGRTVGAIIGNVSHKGTIIASWAEKNGNLEIAGSGNPTIIESAMYENAADITENIVAEMNAAIADFNKNNAEGIQCEYQWEWVSGSWPNLVPSANN